MRPTKPPPVTDVRLWRSCQRKHRWPDEMSARAGALHSLEITDTKKLWIYRCSICRGWHLTKLFTEAHLRVTKENPCPKAR